jgi:DNA-binding NtrC family response regulator
MNHQLPRILVLDDDQDWLMQVPLILDGECVVDGYPTVDQGMQAIQQGAYDIILLDLNFDGDNRDGLDLFRRIHAVDSGADVIVISAETHQERLASVFNAGVSQFITKPATPDQIREAVRRTLRNREMRFKALNLAMKSDDKKAPILIGSSLVMQRLREEIFNVVSGGTKDILIFGETGSGKEVVAQTIARQSNWTGKFIPILCGGLSDGLVESELFGHAKGSFTGANVDRIGAFEAANGGFVFMDEIGELPLNQQVKMLRVLQERTIRRVGTNQEISVNFRMIAATHVDLDKAVSEKKFREDLYFRIAREKIRIPSLRERIEDIPELVTYHLAMMPVHRNKRFTNEAMALLQAYAWPGNVRQLFNVVESLCNRCKDGIIREDAVCQAIPEVSHVFSSRVTKTLVGRYGTQLISSERRRFEKAIIEAEGDRTKAAGILGLSRATFFRKAKDLGLVKARA